MTAVFIFCFMAFFAVGPGVCVWLALSELMPTRIRSNGMSIALVINQAVSTTIAAIFLPTVGKYGYGTMFFAFAAATVIYFVTAASSFPKPRARPWKRSRSISAATAKSGKKPSQNRRVRSSACTHHFRARYWRIWSRSDRRW